MSAYRVLTETATGTPLAWIRGIASPEWSARALCADQDPELFFPTASSGRGGAARMARRSREAKAVCAGCPVRTQCLELAFEADERHGVWGGLDEFERRQLQSRRSPA